MPATLKNKENLANRSDERTEKASAKEDQAKTAETQKKSVEERPGEQKKSITKEQDRQSNYDKYNIGGNAQREEQS